MERSMNLSCAMWGCKSTPSLGRLSALTSVFVRCLSYSHLLPLETGLGAVFISLLGQAWALYVHINKSSCSKNLSVVDSCYRESVLGYLWKSALNIPKQIFAPDSPLPECVWAALPSLSLPGAQQPGRQLTSARVLQNRSKKARENIV